MSNGTSVFPVALLENAVTRPIAFFTSPGNNFILNQSTTAQISGEIYYFQR
jgi:hypothetical protein